VHLSAMHSTIDDIDLQARQGSVAAIIQLLNEHFAEDSIRTRAIQDGRILQLLVEAPADDGLPQETVVERVRTVLESISPRGISRVNINSRIVQEQQLLWLDDIKRDPEKALLWSQPITLRRPNPVVRLWRDLRAPRQRNPFLEDVSRKRSPSSRSAFWRGLIGGASLALLLGLVGWTTKDWLGVDLGLRSPAPISTTPDQPAAPTGQDPFVLAVRIAQQSVEDGRSATTASEWLDLAVRWQRASDLMAEVQPEDDRYDVAQDRVQVYAANREMALQEAEKF
jgi:hypothetical protein